MIRFLAAVWMLGLLQSAVWAGEALSFNHDGLEIDAGEMGKFNWSFPALVGDGDVAAKILTASASGQTAQVSYEGGAMLSAKIGADGTVSYTFTNVPASVKKMTYTLLIGFEFQQGGTWSMQGEKAMSFPVQKPASPHLYGDHAKSFQLANFALKTLAITFPDNSWIELNDNREWNWSIYALRVTHPWAATTSTYTFGFSIGGRSATPVAQVDKFGQIAASDWPGKVKSVEELSGDMASEEAYYARQQEPPWDAFGGMPGSGAALRLTRTGYFHVQKIEAKWALVDPEGNLFFHIGICECSPCDDYTRVHGRESTFEWLPSETDGPYASAYLPNVGGGVLSFHLANMIRKYGKPYDLADFQGRMIDRIKRFGFNSIGDFTALAPEVIKKKNFPYVTGLPLYHPPDIAGLRSVWDPFDATNIATVNKDFASLAASANDSLLIGYFLTNEPAFEDIPKVIPTLKGSQNACKRALVAMLQKKYPDIAAFNRSWAAHAGSFAELNEAPLDVATQQAFEDMHAFTGVFLEAYFKLVRETFDKYDTHHLLIGCRLQPGTINSEQLCRISGKYLDVLSFNYYTDALDKDFLNRIYGWTGRPLFLSEFYWASVKESGLVGGRGVETQRDRGLAYRNYVEQAATLGYVVGIEWFSLVDQAATGRWFEGMNGERANIGLFSATDRPYRPMLEEMKKTNDSIYEVELGRRPPFLFDNPLFVASDRTQRTVNAPRATGPIVVNGATSNWPGIPPEVISAQHKVLGGDVPGVEGTYRLCWDDKNLYALISVIDRTPMQNKLTDPLALWGGDAIELFLGSEKLQLGGPLLFNDRHLVISAGAMGQAAYHDFNAGKPYACDTTVVPGGDGKSYTVELALPWTALNVTPKVGQEFLFDIALDDSADGTIRTSQVTWNGTDKNSTDRTHWGKMKLLR